MIKANYNKFMVLLGIITLLVTLKSAFAYDLIPIGNNAGQENSFYLIDIYYAECVESWTCSAWSECSVDSQTRTCVENNNCGTELNMPSLTQSCVPQEPSDSGGSGSSGSGDTNDDYFYPVISCSEGQITRQCKCGLYTYTTGYCIDGQYYLNDPFADEDTVTDSPVVDSYSFKIIIPKYSYNLTENIDISVKTYKNNLTYNADLVNLKIYKNDFQIESVVIPKIATGQHSLEYVNNLDEGTYDFEFTARFGTTVVKQIKKVEINKNSDIINKIRDPKGNARSWVVIALIGLIAFLLIIGVLIALSQKKK